MNIHPSIQILNLKSKLQSTDYKAIKYSEGWLTEEEYAETKAERQRIRDEINRLEKLLSVGAITQTEYNSIVKENENE